MVVHGSIAGWIQPSFGSPVASPTHPFVDPSTRKSPSRSSGPGTDYFLRPPRVRKVASITLTLDREGQVQGASQADLAPRGPWPFSQDRCNLTNLSSSSRVLGNKHIVQLGKPGNCLGRLLSHLAGIKCHGSRSALVRSDLVRPFSGGKPEKPSSASETAPCRGRVLSLARHRDEAPVFLEHACSVG